MRAAPAAAEDEASEAKRPRLEGGARAEAPPLEASEALCYLCEVRCRRGRLH